MIKRIISYLLLVTLTAFITYGVTTEDWDNRPYETKSVYRLFAEYDSAYRPLNRCPHCGSVGLNLNGGYDNMEELCKECGEYIKLESVVGKWCSCFVIYKPWTWIGDCGWELKREYCGTGTTMEKE